MDMTVLAKVDKMRVDCFNCLSPELTKSSCLRNSHFFPTHCWQPLWAPHWQKWPQCWQIHCSGAVRMAWSLMMPYGLLQTKQPVQKGHKVVAYLRLQPLVIFTSLNSSSIGCQGLSLILMTTYVYTHMQPNLLCAQNFCWTVVKRCTFVDNIGKTTGEQLKKSRQVNPDQASNTFYMRLWPTQKGKVLPLQPKKETFGIYSDVRLNSSNRPLRGVHGFAILLAELQTNLSVSLSFVKNGKETSCNPNGKMPTSTKTWTSNLC